MADVAATLTDDQVNQKIHQTKQKIMEQMKKTFEKADIKTNTMKEDTRKSLEAFDSSLNGILRGLSIKVNRDQDVLNPKKLTSETLGKIKDSWIKINKCTCSSGPLGAQFRTHSCTSDQRLPKSTRT
jgi:hypothetical protein